MIIDNENLYSNAQGPIIADAVSTNVIDHGSGKFPGLARGSDLRLLIQVVEAFDNLTDLVVEFQESVDEAFTSPVVLASTTLLLADLVVGAKFGIRHAPAADLRYTRLNYDLTGTAPTTGKITAGLILDEQDWVAYEVAVY